MQTSRRDPRSRILTRRAFAVAAWIALCAMLMACVAPGVSRMLATDMGPDCHMADPGAMQHAGHKAALPGDACGYCTMQGDLPALPPLPPRVDLANQVLRFAPPLFFIAPRPLFAWLAPRSRAPPR